jgi:carboxyl-terminal processing protease
MAVKTFYNRRRLALIGAVIALASALLGSRIEHAFSQDNNLQEVLSKYGDVMTLVQRYYVDKPNLTELNEAAIKGMLSKLDPHSYYMGPKYVKESAEQFSGKFEGIGIQFILTKNDTILVDATIPGGPSETLGIMAGDKIIAINGRRTTGFTEDSVRNNLRGPKGTQVSVSIVRTGVASPLNFTITRDVIPIYSVMASFMVDDETGYLNIGRFAETTYNEMVDSLRVLRSLGMKQLILDLRGNPGGLLDQAVKIADEFIGGTQTIVSTKGRLSVFDDVDISRPGNQYEKIPLVVLIDRGSASASEIVSGALQDLDRAIVVGTTSFGKGLVQRQFSLGSDGSAVRLTISRYYTPLGRSIQRPYDGAKYKEFEDAADAEEEVENFTHDKDVASNDTTRPKYKTATGRIVYGGGGITPDYIIKNDTVTKATVQLFAASLFYDWVKEYVSNNAPMIKKKYTRDAFIKSFEIPESAFESIYKNAAEKKIEFNKEDFLKDKSYVALVMKGDIARQLYGQSARAKILLENDRQYQKAYSLLGEAQKLAFSHDQIKKN